MTSLETSGTSTKTGTERTGRDASVPRDVKADGRGERARRSGSERRCSPDPFVATDRYRLTMPYADRI